MSESNDPADIENRQWAESQNEQQKDRYVWLLFWALNGFLLYLYLAG